jgi:hypothetical protein
MSDPRPTRETMSIEEATVSNMWEIAARKTRGVSMRRLAFVVCLLSLSSLVGAESLWSGTWVLREPPQGSHLTMTLEEVGTGWKLTYKIAGQAPGSPVSTVLTQLDGMEASLSIDGKPSGETMAIKRIDSRHTVSVQKFQGKEAGTSKAEISPNGKVLTVENECATSNPTGQVGKQIQYWDRQR